MVLRLKTRESRSLPGLLNATFYLLINKICTINKAANAAYSHSINAGWSSPVARQAHNLKAAGSNPAPATKINNKINTLRETSRGVFCVSVRPDRYPFQRHGSRSSTLVIL